MKKNKRLTNKVEILDSNDPSNLCYVPGVQNSNRKNVIKKVCSTKLEGSGLKNEGNLYENYTYVALFIS